MDATDCGSAIFSSRIVFWTNGDRSGHAACTPETQFDGAATASSWIAQPRLSAVSGEVWQDPSCGGVLPPDDQACHSAAVYWFTLAIFSCIDCWRSVRVPTLMLVVIRGAPIA